jgi:hypothetical protein
MMTRAEMEERRLDAALFLSHGASQAAAARLYGVSRTNYDALGACAEGWRDVGIAEGDGAAVQAVWRATAGSLFAVGDTGAVDYG